MAKLDFSQYAVGTLPAELTETTSGNYTTQWSANANGELQMDSLSGGIGICYLDGNANGLFSIEIMSTSLTNTDKPFGIIFRGEDKDNYWFAHMSDGNRLRVGHYQFGTTTLYDEVLSGSGDLDSGEWGRLFVQLEGESIKVGTGANTIRYETTSSLMQNGTWFGAKSQKTQARYRNMEYTSASAVIPAKGAEPSFTLSGRARGVTTIGVLDGVHSKIAEAGEKIESWPTAVDMKHFPNWPYDRYPLTFWTSSNHSYAGGGWYVRILDTQAGVFPNQESILDWDEVSNRPEFDHIAAKTCPVFSETDGDFTQCETPAWFFDDDGTAKILFHTKGSVNYGDLEVVQNTHLATCSNGIDISVVKRSIIEYDPYNEVGYGHTGYTYVLRNPIEKYPYKYISFSAHGGGSKQNGSTTAVWGINALDGSETYEIINILGWIKDPFMEQFQASLGPSAVLTVLGVEDITKEGDFYRVQVSARREVDSDLENNNNSYSVPVEILINEDFEIVAEPRIMKTLGATGEADELIVSKIFPFSVDGVNYGLNLGFDSTYTSSLMIHYLNEINYDWEVKRPLSNKNILASHETDGAAINSLTFSETPSYVAGTNVTRMPLPSSGDAATLSAASVVPSDYDVLDIKFKRIGKTSADDIGGEIGLFDSLTTPSNGVSLYWPYDSDPDNPPISLRVYQDSSVLENPTDKYIGNAYLGGIGVGFDSVISKQWLTLRLIPAERKVMLLEGGSPKNVFDTWAFDFTQPLTPAAIFSNKSLNSTGAIDLESLEIIAYSNDFTVPVSKPPALTVSAIQTVPFGANFTIVASATDFNNEDISYQWEQIGGTAVTITDSTAQTLTATAPAGTGFETLCFKCTATNENGKYNEAVTFVAVNENAITTAPLPTVSVTANTSGPIVGDTVTFNATVTDTNNIIWTKTGGITLNNTTGVSVTGTITAEGAYSVTATASGAGGSASDSVNGTATTSVVPNQPPTANAGPNQSVAAGATCILEGSASSDSDGTIASYSWRKVSGPTIALANANQAVASFIAPSESTIQTLVFELIVTDDDGVTSAPDTVTVTVAAVPDVADPLDPTLSVFNIKSKVGIEDDNQSFGIASLYQYTDNFILCEVLSKAGTSLTPDAFSQAEYRIVDNKGANVVKLALGTGIKEADGKFLIHINAGILNKTHKGSLKHQFVVWNQAGHKLPPIFGGTVNVIPVLEPTL